MPDTTTRLLHSGLQVPAPHPYAVTGYSGHRTPDGVAYTATLRKDGRIIGTIENSGHGGPTTFYPKDRATYGYDELNAWVAQCRDADGNAAYPESVLEDLVTEYEIGREVAKLAKVGRTMLRLMDYFWGSDDRPIGAPFMSNSATATAPRTEALRASLRDSVVARYGIGSEYGWWQIWTGEAWEDLTERRPMA